MIPHITETSGTEAFFGIPYCTWHSLATGRCYYNLELVIFKLISRYIVYFLWNCTHVNATRPHWRLVNVGSGNGLVLSGNKPLPDPTLTRVYVAWPRHNEQTNFDMILYKNAHKQHVQMSFRFYTASHGWRLFSSYGKLESISKLKNCYIFFGMLNNFRCL